MLQDIQNFLITFDYGLWYYLNTEWHNYILDAIMPFFRNQWSWAPLYLFLLMFMTMNFGRRGWMWCIFFLLTFAISDYLSASVLKPIFVRMRPCNTPFLQTMVHNIVPCGSGPSFPSAHAANHFALGVFMATTLHSKVKGIWWMTMTWALMIGYAQVYVGVHFPLDVICGGMLGAAAGILTGNVYNRLYDLNKPLKVKTTATAP
ncbi:MAG: hypothetical protein K0R82_7 [Flavipsychrobacter sp.]|jgi:undecaprenyl-diphosphatase|nr:hypothetical protein [Flavipsychrobacter sp.]